MNTLRQYIDKFSFRTIRGKIMLLSLFFLVILLFLVVFEVFQNQQIIYVSQRAVDVNTPVSTTTGHILTSLYHVSTLQRGYFLTLDNKLREERLEVWHEIHSYYKRLVETKPRLDNESVSKIEGLGILLGEYERLQLSMDNYVIENTVRDAVSISDTTNQFNNEDFHGRNLAYLQESMLKNIIPLQKRIENLIVPLSNLQDEALQRGIRQVNDNLKNANLYLLLVSLLSVFGMSVFVYVIVRSLNVSIAQPNNLLEKLALGEIEIEIQEVDNELNEIVKAAIKLRTHLSNASDFALAIGEGRFDAAFEPASENDKLGNALLQMQHQLHFLAREDEKRNWTTSGLAKFSEILRKHNNDFKLLAEEVTGELVKYIGASQGAFFIYTQQAGEPCLEMIAAYAHTRRKQISARVSLAEGYGEGLVGQAFIEKDTLYITDVPQDYSFISSGLGETPPKCILFVPLKINEEVEGVLEIASIKHFQNHEISFAEKLAESIAASLKSVKTNEKTRRLLESTQEQAELMRSQEEEMRQNLEELAATQEEMHRRQLELEHLKSNLEQEVEQQTIELKKTLTRFDLALAGTTEGLWEIVLEVAGLDQNCYCWWSPKFNYLLGYDETELEPTFASWQKLIHPEDYQRFFVALQEHLDDYAGLTAFDEEIRLQHKTQNYSWYRIASAVLRDKRGKPLRCAGAIGDISAQKALIEQQSEITLREARLNAFIQNTNDSILAVDNEFNIILANDVFLQSLITTGVVVKIGQTNLLDTIRDSATRNRTQKNIEAVFAGDKFSVVETNSINDKISYLQISYHPIKGEKNEIVGVSIVARDITELRKQQLESEEARKQLAAILDGYQASISLKDVHGKFLLINQQYAKQIGKDKNQIIGRVDKDVLAEFYTESLAENDLLAWQYGSIHKEEMMISNGKRAFFDSYRFLIYNTDNQAYAICNIALDITERKKLEDKLKQSEQRAQQIINNTPGVLYQFLLDTDSGLRGFTYISESCREMFAAEPDELIGIYAADEPLPFRIDGEQQVTFFEEMEKAAKNHLDFVWEGKVLIGKSSADESFVWIRTEAKSKALPDGSIVWDGLMLDITERKMGELATSRALIKLASVEEKYQSLQGAIRRHQQAFNMLDQHNEMIANGLPGALLLLGYDSPQNSWQIQQVSQGVLELSGYEASAFKYAEIVLKDLVYQADKLKFLNAEPLRIQAIQQQNSYTIRYRLVDKSGKIKLVMEKGRGIVHPQTKELFLEIFITDITALRPNPIR